MKRKCMWGVLLLVTGCFLFFACSISPETESDKGAIKQLTDQTAHEIVNHIRKPINKARAAKKIGDDRVDHMDKHLEALMIDKKLPLCKRGLVINKKTSSSSTTTSSSVL